MRDPLLACAASLARREPIGSSAHFWNAAASKTMEVTKTVKFIDSPTIEQLRRQLVTVTEKLPMICDVEKSLDVDMEL